MLTLFRKHATSWLIKVALFAIVIVFIFWGGYSYQSRKASRLARVGDVYITYADYNRAYDQLLNMYRQRFGNQLNQELLERLNVKKQALDLLIDRVLIALAAQKLGLETTAEELQREVLKYPVFQRNGRFDRDLYVRVLLRNRMTPEVFEQQLAQDLTLRKVERFVKNQAVVTDGELNAALSHEYSEIKIAYVTFDPAAFEKDVSVDEKAVRAYFEKNKERYKEPEKRRFAWVVFRAEDFLDQVSVKEDEVRAYYDDHPGEFYQEKEVRARHILFRLKQGASPEEEKKVEEKARKVLELARKGENFAKLAEKYSEGPTAKKGGDLGYFTHDRMVPAFADAAFALKPGEISDLVRTPFGFHIIKTEDVRPEKTIPFEEARKDIEKKLKMEKAKDVAYARARDFADMAFADGDVVKAAERLKLTVHHPGTWFSALDSLPSLGNAANVVKEFFSLDQGQVSNIIEIPDGYVVGQVKEVKAPQVPPFEKVKDRVAEDYRKDQAREKAREAAKAFIQAVSKSRDFQKAAKAAGLDVKETGWFSRNNPDDKLPLWGEAAEKVFLLTSKHPVSREPLMWRDKVLVCSLLDRRPPSKETIEKSKEKVKAQILQKKQEQLWQAWLAKQREETEVEILQKI